MVMNCSALQLFLAYNLRKLLKISKFTLDYIVQYRIRRIIGGEFDLEFRQIIFIPPSLNNAISGL